MIHRHTLTFILATLALLLEPAIVRAQRAELIDTSAGLYTASFPDGMVSKTNFKVVKDKDGFMWFSTPSGVERYDGLTFRHYPLGKSLVRGYRDGFMVQMVIGDDGVIWTHTERSVVSRYNAERDCFEEVVGANTKGMNSALRTLYPMEDMLLLGMQHGLMYFDLKQDSVVAQYAKDLDVICIVPYTDCKFLLGTNKGVWSYDFTDQHLTSIFGQHLNISALCYDKRRDIIWVGTKGSGLYVVDNKMSGRYSEISNSQDAIINVVRILNDTVLMVGTDGQGLRTCVLPNDANRRVEPQPLRLLAGESLEAPVQLPNSVVDDILVDDGKLWVSMDMSGIALLKPRQRVTVMTNPEATANADRAALDVSVDQEGRTWVAYSRCLACYDRPDAKPQIYLRNVSGYLTVLAARDGTVWCGGYNAGTYHLDPRTGKYEFFRSVADQPVLDCVYAFCEDRDHDIWIGGLNFPLTRMHPDGKGGYERAQYDVRMATDIRQLDDNRLAVGTFDGLFLVDINSRHTERLLCDESTWSYTNSIASLVVTGQNEIWIATMGAGLACHNTQTGVTTLYGTEYSLPGLELRGIEQLNDSVIVASTEKNGLFAFDIRHHRVLRSLRHADGQMMGIMSRSSSGANPDQSLLVFGSEDGATAIEECDITEEPDPYHIFVTCEQMADGKVTLPADSRTLDMQFTTNDIFHQDEYRFEYILVGHTNVWQTIDDTRRLRYLNMPAGNYTMKVRAYSAASLVDEIEIPITVEIVFWLRWYCLLAYALMALGLVWFVAVHYRVKHVSETDALTGIRNRYAGQSKIVSLLQQHKPGVFVLMDCDKFKHVNDTYGHKVGDQLLIAVAHALRSTFPNQVTMRLGGDEFALYMAGRYTEEQFFGLMKQLTQAFEAISIPEMGQTRASVSMGAAFYDGKQEVNFDHLYTMADERLYKSKEHDGCWVTID